MREIVYAPQNQGNGGIRHMALVKLSPVFLLVAMLLGGMDILIASPLATVAAGILAILIDRYSYQQVLEAALNNAKQLMIILFLLMIAYAMAEAFMASGVGASIIGISLKLGLTAKSVATASLLITAVLSTATGTSWGTFAACVPIFLWLSHIIGGNPLLTVAAIAGGSCFGDNIGLISDTTVLSSGIQEVDIIHRVRHQGVWSLLCLVSAAVLFYIVSQSMGLPETRGDAAQAINAIPSDIWATLETKRPSAIKLLNQVRSGVPAYMLVPIIVVIGLAVFGVSTLPCLGAGIFLALVFGRMAGTIGSVSSYLELVRSGFAEAGSWSVAMTMWTGAFGGIMRLMNAFDPISNLILSISRRVRQLIFYNGVMCLVTNAALGDCTGQIVTVGPVIKEMVENNVEGSPEDIYTLRLRNATMSDAFGVLGSQLIPWHGYMIFFTGMAMTVYPLYTFTPMGIIAYNYLSIIAVVSMLVLTYTGLDRFIPLFRIPSEPQVRLKGRN
jgi:Na+/H+ antiporter NhaC